MGWWWWVIELFSLCSVLCVGVWTYVVSSRRGLVLNYCCRCDDSCGCAWFESGDCSPGVCLNFARSDRFYCTLVPLTFVLNMSTSFSISISVSIPATFILRGGSMQRYLLFADSLSCLNPLSYFCMKKGGLILNRLQISISLHVKQTNPIRTTELYWSFCLKARLWFTPSIFSALLSLHVLSAADVCQGYGGLQILIPSHLVILE